MSEPTDQILGETGFVVSDKDISTILENAVKIRGYKDTLTLMGIDPAGTYDSDIQVSIASLLLLQTDEVARLEAIIKAANTVNIQV